MSAALSSDVAVASLDGEGPNGDGAAPRGGIRVPRFDVGAWFGLVKALSRDVDLRLSSVDGVSGLRELKPLKSRGAY